MRSPAPPRGIYTGRRRANTGTDRNAGPAAVGLIPYPNVPRLIGALVSARMATLHELQTVYGVQDAYDMLEVQTVDAHNDHLVFAMRATKAR